MFLTKYGLFADEYGQENDKCELRYAQTSICNMRDAKEIFAKSRKYDAKILAYKEM